MPVNALFNHTIEFWDDDNSGFFRYVQEAVLAKRTARALQRFSDEQEPKIRKEEEETNKLFRKPTAELNAKVQETLKKKLKEQAHNPNISGIGPYKLHITLSPESYTPELREQLKNIILKYSHEIPNFKYINPQRLESGLNELNTFVSILDKLESKVRKNENFSDEEREQFTAIKQHYQQHLPSRARWKTFLTIETKDITQLLATVRKEQSKQQKAYDRFSEADQFTLYIPTTYNKQDILRMCQEIDTLLTKSDAKPGKRAITELGLGKFINFRQEFLLKDYQQLSKEPEWYESQRISAGETAEYIVDKVQNEMQRCALYQYLNTNFTTPAPADKWQKIWDDTSGTSFEKACALLLKYSCSYAKKDDNKTSYWGGSFGRFFSGRWNSHHGDAVQNTLNSGYKIPKEEQTLSFLLNKLQTELGESIELNPAGDLRRILTIIGANTNFANQEDLAHESEENHTPYSHI
jgi:hypothetical protein